MKILKYIIFSSILGSIFLILYHNSDNKVYGDGGHPLKWQLLQF